jgi:hypothetical protein
MGNCASQSSVLSPEPAFSNIKQTVNPHHLSDSQPQPQSESQADPQADPQTEPQTESFDNMIPRMEKELPDALATCNSIKEAIDRMNKKTDLCIPIIHKTKFIEYTYEKTAKIGELMQNILINIREIQPLLKKSRHYANEIVKLLKREPNTYSQTDADDLQKQIIKLADVICNDIELLLSYVNS